MSQLVFGRLFRGIGLRCGRLEGFDDVAGQAQFPHRGGHGVATTRLQIVAFFQRGLVEAQLFLPWGAQKARSEIFESCQVLEERADGEGAFLRVRGEPEAVKRLQKQFGRIESGRPV